MLMLFDHFVLVFMIVDMNNKWFIKECNVNVLATLSHHVDIC